MGHTQKKQFIGKEIYKQSSHGRDVSSENTLAPSPILKHL